MVVLDTCWLVNTSERDLKTFLYLDHIDKYVLPYQVIQELDGMKDMKNRGSLKPEDRDLQLRARTAINALFKAFMSHKRPIHMQVEGESEPMTVADRSIKDKDHLILQCLIFFAKQAKDEGTPVVFLTHDTMLQFRAKQQRGLDIQCCRDHSEFVRYYGRK
jgi:predicted ribonuclease YlaK